MLDMSGRILRAPPAPPLSATRPLVFLRGCPLRRRRIGCANGRRPDGKGGQPCAQRAPRTAAGGVQGMARFLQNRGKRRDASRMDNFLQQLINGVTLGSIYGLIAIGYTMVYGIIGMVNFAHGDVFMLSAFIALLIFMILTQILHLGSLPLAFVVVLIAAMALTGLWNWSIERLAYRPLRGSFRLAPLISAIGMSIFLSNFVQVVQGPRNKPAPALPNYVFHLGEGGVTLSVRQILIMVVTVVLLAFWYLVQHTSLGR